MTISLVPQGYSPFPSRVTEHRCSILPAGRVRLSLQPFAIRPFDPVHDPNLPVDTSPNVDKIINFFQKLGVDLSGQHPLRSLSQNMCLAQEHTVFFVGQHSTVVGRIRSTQNPVNIPTACKSS